MPYKLSVLQDNEGLPEPLSGYDPAIEELAVFLNGLLNEMLNAYINQSVTVYGAKALELCTLSSTDDRKQVHFVIEHVN